MLNLRLRTKFLLTLLLVSFGVISATLWMVGRSVRVQLHKEIAEDLSNSVVVFRDFHRQREISLSSLAELLANLPNLQALMTTRDTATIQDESADIWRHAPSDVFVLADPTGEVMAIHTSTPGFTRSSAQELFKNSLATDQPSFWWYGGGHLYQVLLRPIYFGAPKTGSVLGVLAIGREISEALATEVSRVASSQVAFFYGDKLIATTVQPEMESQLANVPAGFSENASMPAEVRIGEETFLATTVEVPPGVPPFVRLSVLKSYDRAAGFLDSLNRRLLMLGLVTILIGTTVVFFVSYTFTRPLANLVSGVQALGTGDFAYPLTRRRGDEIAELTAAFGRMRVSLQQSQQKLIASERLATIGRTASSISHDLRHPLTAVVANAEFLCDADLDPIQREELYREIRTAVDQLTDLVDSLLEFSQAPESLRRVFGRVADSVDRARQTVQANPDFHNMNIRVVSEGRCETWFDQRKVERALMNMIRNACEFVPFDSGRVEVRLREERDMIEIRIEDNGPGIAEPIREKLFQPFVSYGKQNGVGLGLTIGQKIFQDHGGNACLEITEPGRTVFKLTLPILVSGDGILSD